MKIKIKLIRNALALSKSKGFTLIELLVVVAIIGILATVVIINVSGAKASSRYVKTVAEMSEISKATLQYRAEHNGTWPKEWSGYNSWVHDFDGVTHIFYNNITDSAAPLYNDFLVDYMGGQRFKPECPTASYSFYNYTSYPSYQIIRYWPYNNGNISTTYAIQGQDSYPSILDKTTKQLKCGTLTKEQLAE